MTQKFSIIIPHYDKSITDNRLMECIKSLYSQRDRNFEVLFYHDGPLSRELPFYKAPDSVNTKYWDEFIASFQITITDTRHNDWGHSLRDIGIKSAKGEYIIHLNSDNILYPLATYKLGTELNRQRPTFPGQPNNNNIVIFPIVMKGMQSNGKVVWRERGNEAISSMIFTGYPTVKYNIDCMQLVMKRDIWLSEGGWKDKSEESDGNMYPYFVDKYGARYCSEILGEHW